MAETQVKVTLEKKVELGPDVVGVVDSSYWLSQSKASELAALGIVTIDTLSAPTVSAVSPTSAEEVEGDSYIALVLTGTNFNPSSAVLFNGAIVESLYINPTTIVARINIGDLAVADDYPVAVRSYQLTSEGNLTAVNTVTPAEFEITA